ncbi:MAG TPA: NFACT RNA binding domain-containing protein, partial [Anaeromyxobacteraceae bacterium]|nr:NFACT RNA binding domain-containing protein [Anaeromyxobacteraceae bacterium]
PFAFQGLLRKELEGARLAALETIPGDRVVSLRFDRVQGSLSLVAELTGRHGNLFLVGADGIVRATAGRNLSQRRDLVAGRPYVAPAVPPGLADADRFAPEPGAAFPRSAAVERRYRALEAERVLVEARRRLREPLRAAAARAKRALEKLADEAARVPAAEEDRRRGDLLKSNLHLVRRGAREVEVTEWTEAGARPVTIALEPALTPQANLERYYRHYRRIADSAARVAARTGEVRAREAALRALLAEVDAAALDQLPRLEREARKLGAGPRRAPAAKKKRRDEPLPPYRTFRALSGATILVGRGAAQNDELTHRVAKGNDLWLHVRGQTGAHVVVRLDKGRGPDQDALLDAAHLAAHFSDARGEAQVDVAYTRAKYVRKPKGAAPGAVVYTQEKVLLLRVEAGRIERLLGEEAGE